MSMLQFYAPTLYFQHATYFEELHKMMMMILAKNT